MDHIVDLIKEQAKMNEVTQPTPTEKSQIVIAFRTLPALVMRYNKAKRGEAVYDKLVTAWANYDQGLPTIYHVPGDMFSSWVDLSQIATISFVDHAKRAKFVPI